MATQLQLEFDPRKLRLMRAILLRVDQQELIKELSRIFFNFVQIENKEELRGESNHQ
jgi:hypothetical protein